MSAPPTVISLFNNQLICCLFNNSNLFKMKFFLLGGLVLIYCALNVLGDEQKSKIDDPPIAKRAFYDTPYGQIHYKYGGDFDSRSADGMYYTFLLFHGNPRSCDEFTELVHELTNRFFNLSVKFSYIAMDLLGEGHSDDPMVSNSNPNSGYVSMEQYAGFMIEIASKVFKMAEDFPSGNSTRYIVPLGSLTGSAIATELSYQLTLRSDITSLCKMGHCKVLTTILHDPMYYFSDQIVANVHSYANQERNWQPQEDGQHLVEIWNDPNYQPYKDLALQDRKSLDRFRAATTQWQVILSYADYNSKSLIGRLTALSKLNMSRSMVSPNSVNSGPSVPPLIIFYGGEFLNDTMMEK